MPIDDAPRSTADFPAKDDLCESCGYPLQGLTAQGDCPECGQGIGDSDPAIRVGLPWQRRMTPWAWLGAIRRFAFSPNTTYRQLTLGGSNLPARVYLGMVAVLVMVGWGIVRGAAQLDNVLLWSIIAGGTVVTMTYIEAMGVTYFSKRKGWRVPWRDAERVACYASIGWVPAAAILAKVRLIQATHALTGSWPRWWPQAWLPDVAAGDIVTLGIIGSIAILGFEWLVWFGVKRVRFGNRRAPIADKAAHQPIS